MKKIILSCAAIVVASFITNSANAQVFTATYVNNSNDTLVTTGTIGNNELKPAIKLELATGVDSFTYNWQVIEYSFPAGWDFVGLCDNIICLPFTEPQYTAPYPPSTTSNYVYETGNPALVMNDVHLQLKVPIATAANGIGYFKYKLTTADVMPSSAMPANPQAIEILHVINKTPSGNSVKNIIIGANDVKVYPNPATDYVTMEFAAHLGVTQIEVVDITGRKVFQENVNGTSTTISMNKLVSGNYFINVKNSDGINMITKKLIKK